MKVIGIIPARMASSRFPGKPLAKIKGIPMLGHVFQRSKQSPILQEVYLATCDEEIRQYGASIGAEVIMTSDRHERASDRVAEALLEIEKKTGDKIDIVVMIQGDEPMVTAEMIARAVQPLIEDETILVSNLMAPLRDRDEQNDPNEVKVVFDRNKFALYFSREPIPSWKKGAKEVPMFKQVCVIPFRRNFLLEFNLLAPTPLEIVESVDMLRVLEHGYRVKLVEAGERVYSVDTEEDRQWVEAMMS